jgi:GTPase
MKWRLEEGNGEAVYELGVLDNGIMQGLDPRELAETMKSMYKMAASASASLFILNERCVYGKPQTPTCRKVVEVLVKKKPSEQPFTDMRIALLGSAGCGKSSLCGVLTQGTLDNGQGKSRLNLLRYLHEVKSGKTSSITIDCFGFNQNGEVSLV